MTHTLLGDADNLVVVFAERDPLDGGGELPEEQTFACLHGPETHGVVGGTADEEARLGCMENDRVGRAVIAFQSRREGIWEMRWVIGARCSSEREAQFMSNESVHIEHEHFEKYAQSTSIVHTVPLCPS